MKVCGFTFIKNASKYDYPIEEAIRSVLPLCTDFVVVVGQSDDDTLHRIQQLAPERIRIVESIWDESLREGGRVLAVETDKAYAAIPDDCDWCFYIQGDEVVHENDWPLIRQAMHDYLHQDEVEGLLFRYLHFYGSYDYIATSSNFYKKEVRIIRKRPDIFSYRDAQGFRKLPNEKLMVKAIDACIYHYGWVKPPAAMQAKQQNFHRYWHSDQWVDQHVAKAVEFDYSGLNSLDRFRGTHPAVMTNRIKTRNWTFDFDLNYRKTRLKDRFKNVLFRLTGIDMNYKNYRLLR
ncbi:MAG TPA: glycosyltransferase family 2 protein [Chitinophagaceae bacterium]|nr:glycosyltransferase family 2 protein [Chitinophagaceae bacterium]